MGAIVLIDTSVLLNLLDIPGRNDRKAEVFAQMEAWIDQDAHLRLPIAAIFEGGNLIARSDLKGQVRRSSAQRFVQHIQAALRGEEPWKPMHLPDHAQLALWLDDFPDAAMRGLSLGDLSIRKEWDAQCQQFPMTRVLVWSLDADLAGLDRSV